MPLYDFKCDSCNTVLEKFTGYDTAAITCDCGGLMKKQLCCPRVTLDGTNPDFPGAYEKWGKDREKRAEQHKKKSYYEG
jgi:putative FmdB family regulatory protein